MSIINIKLKRKKSNFSPSSIYVIPSFIFNTYLQSFLIEINIIIGLLL